MLKQRVLTAVVLVAALLAALAWSPLAFAALVTLALAIAQAEWLSLSGWPYRSALSTALSLGACLVLVQALRPQWIEFASVPLAWVATLAWVTIGMLLFRLEGRGGPTIARPLSRILAFVLTIAAWCALMIFLRAGAWVLLSVMLVVWVADTAAYFAGRAFGRTRLAPHISPGKTWAGVWGAMIGVSVAALAAYVGWPQAPVFTSRAFATFGIPVALALLAALVALSIVGDLFESLLKRQAGVKDSGHLLPGHGGFYDRIDALLALLPPAVLIWGSAA